MRFGCTASYGSHSIMQNCVDPTSPEHPLQRQPFFDAHRPPWKTARSSLHGPSIIVDDRFSAISQFDAAQHNRAPERKKGHRRRGGTEPQGRPQQEPDARQRQASDTAQWLQRQKSHSHSDVHVTAEYQLIVNCCRRSFENAPSAPLPIEANVDWERVMELARFHRVQGLVWTALRESGATLPHDIAQQFNRDAAEIAARSLTAAAECRRLLSGFQRKNIPLLFLKGITLAQLAYRDPHIKSAIDIDVLVDPAQLMEAAQTLRDLGYGQMFPVDSAQGRPLDCWHFRSKESVWGKAGSQVHLDLHTRLVDNPALIPSIGINSPTQQVEVGGIALPALATDEMFAYLCVHGASCAWFRLKWISDLAGLIARFESHEIDHLYRRAQELGAGRAAAQALLVADHEFEALRNNAALRAKLLEDGVNRRLFRAALRQLHGATGVVERRSNLFANARMHWAQLFLLPGGRFIASEIARQVRMALLFRSEISKLKRARMASGLSA